ncbi:MAG: sugar ABC transporter permease [Clostridia bacterium]|nr:sugar ABC transporter permease [Clostridia bacterium]
MANSEAKAKNKKFFSEWLRYQFKEMRKNGSLYLFMLPYLLVFATFTILPVIVAMYFSFTYFNVLEPPQWTGFDNYIRLFTADDLFMTAFKNTIFFAVIVGPGGYIMSLFFAWLINELGRRTRAVMTLFYYAPSLANVYVVWKIIFSSDQYGLLNGFLMNTGITLTNIKWLENVDYIVPCCLIVILWSSLGTSFLTFIAGLQNVDRTLYEAGAIDGVKNRWQELWYITLPYMKPQLMFGAVMSISGAFSVGGAITALVGYPSQDYVAHTLIHHLEDYANQRMELGYACAIAVLLFLLQIFANKIIAKMLSKVGE